MSRITVLDEDFETIYEIDDFISFIWTDRYDAYGDFELVVGATIRGGLGLYADRVRVGYFLKYSESDKIMMVENAEKSLDGENREVLTVKGRSLEALLTKRVIVPKKGFMAPGAVTVKNTADYLAHWLVTQVCVTGVLDVQDIIPGLTVIHDGPWDGTDMFQWEIQSKDLYTAIVDLLTPEDLGFRITNSFTPTTKSLNFEAYKGQNLASDIINFGKGVKFDPDLDNIRDMKALRTSENNYTVAYVLVDPEVADDVPSLNYFHEVTLGSGDASGQSGFKRRVLVVDGSDIPRASFNFYSEYLDAVVKRGRDALREGRQQVFLDGEVIESNTFKYRRDFFLGDVISLGSFGLTDTDVRVTEWIHSVDASGYKSYPTFTEI